MRRPDPLTPAPHLTVGGRERTFEAVSGATPPKTLLLVLHGSNQSGAKVRAFSGHSFDQLAARDNAIVVYADAYKGPWNDARSTVTSRARTDGGQ
jgi:polyhydroxybutyrate depolymerase